MTEQYAIAPLVRRRAPIAGEIEASHARAGAIGVVGDGALAVEYDVFVPFTWN